MKYDFYTSAVVSIACVALVIVCAYGQVNVSTKAINEQCGTHYSKLDVFFAGDEITSLCKITNQQITVNQK